MDDEKNREYDGKQYFRIGPEWAYLYYSLTGLTVGELTEKVGRLYALEKLLNMLI